MARLSVSLSEPNDNWLKSQISDHNEFTNKSDLINDLIRQARRSEAVNAKLKQAEESGFVDQSKDDMLAEFKARINK